MPTRPAILCKAAGCFKTTADGYCPNHQQKKHGYDQHRPSAAKRGYGRRWQKARKRYLAENPECVDCLKDGIVEPATVVDHIIPHKGDMQLFWDRGNWQALCETHHNIKTMGEGAFGQDHG